MRMIGLGQKKTPTIDPRYATFNRRMLAATVDTTLLALLMPLIAGLVNHFAPSASIDIVELTQKAQATGQDVNSLFWKTMIESGSLANWIDNAVIQTFLLFLFCAVCWHYWSATPGKMLFRIKIVDAETGAHITSKQIALRLVGYVVSGLALCIGYFWIGIDKRRQGWHDKIANTVVVRANVKSNSPAADPSGFPAP